MGGGWWCAASAAVGSAAVVPAFDVVHDGGPGSEPGAEAFVVVELGFEVGEVGDPLAEETDVDDVVRMANDTHYGLAAYVWTNDLKNALNTAHRIESGWVQVNQGGGQVVGQSYGGYKQSGIGREVSLEGMLAGFTQTKQINAKLGG